jgi:hypothetical protein
LGKILFKVSGAYDLSEYRWWHDSEDGKSYLYLEFKGGDGECAIKFTNPYSIDSTFELFEDFHELVVYDSKEDQWEKHTVKAEYFVESFHEFWAEAFDIISGR